MKTNRNVAWQETETCLSLRVPKDVVAALHEFIDKKARAAGIPVPTTTAYVRMLIEREIKWDSNSKRN